MTTLPIADRELLVLDKLHLMLRKDPDRDVNANDLSDALDLDAREMVEVMAVLVGKLLICEKGADDDGAMGTDIYTLEPLRVTWLGVHLLDAVYN